MSIHLSKRDLRLSSGIVLFAYIAGHFINHALGLISISAAEQGLRLATAIWQSAAGTILLYGAAIVHVALALVALYQHRTLRLPILEWLRIGAGLSIPTLLIGHAVDTRLALEVSGHPADYTHVVWALWHSGREGRQIALLVPGWLHGCLGLNFVLKSRPIYARFGLVFFSIALLLPVLAVLGFFSMLKEVTVLAQDPSWIATSISQASNSQPRSLVYVRDALLILYCASIATVFCLRVLRSYIEERRKSLVSIGYPGRMVKVPAGWSVLEASRAHHIAHVSLCGGRARCSTCRVHIVAGQDLCPPPAESERRTLERIHAPAGTRLACQLRPQGNIRIIPLVAAQTRSLRDSADHPAERQFTVMLAEMLLRGNGHRTLSHDLLYVLNRFGETVGETIRAAGGVPNQFMDHRVMALFEARSGSSEANQQALDAAFALDAALRNLRSQLQQELGCEMNHAIYLHYGAAIAGETGDMLIRTATAIGDAVDVVRQIANSGQFSVSSSSTEEPGRIVASRAVLNLAGQDTNLLAWRRLLLHDGHHLEAATITVPVLKGSARPQIAPET